ncbi:MAG: uroporphyrinogen-III synthase [Cocleimonas sp.]|nr:uroporphyrinogen-III synthase [Cocleimonas sp.]
MTKSSLQHCWIAITRPVHQAGQLTLRLEAEGAQVFSFPLLEIIAPTSPAQVHQQAQHLKHYDTAIFISPNAVKNAFTFVSKAQLAGLKIAAVGKKTAQTLQQHGLSVDCFPQTGFNSEALLALDKMQRVENQQMIIFRGEGGRELLRNTLISRGATVDYLNVYARRCPMLNLDQLKYQYQQNKLDIIVITSGESLAHLLRLSHGEQWLFDLPLLVGSQRIKNKFQSKFRGKIHVSANPSDETMYQALQQWRSS